MPRHFGSIRSCSCLTSSVSSQTQVFRSLNRRWRCCSRQSEPGGAALCPAPHHSDGPPKLKCFLHLFALGPQASLFATLLCPCFTSVAQELFPLFIFFPPLPLLCGLRYFHSPTFPDTLPLPTNTGTESWHG